MQIQKEGTNPPRRQKEDKPKSPPRSKRWVEERGESKLKELPERKKKKENPCNAGREDEKITSKLGATPT